jgi:cell division protein FtsB
VKRLTLIVAGIAAVVALGLFSSIVSQGFEQLTRAEEQRAELLRERQRLERRILELEEILRAVRSDPEAVESMARHDLGWTRPGERLIVLATPTPAPRPVTLTGPTPTPILSLPK